MKREDSAKLRELKRMMPTFLKNSAKKYGVKKKSFMLWTVKDDLFFDAQIDIWFHESKDELSCSCRVNVKPLWTDDLLWEIIDMPENKNEHLSLRSIGAFTFWGIKAYDKMTSITKWSVEETEKSVDDHVRDFKSFAESYTADMFYSNTDGEFYQKDLFDLLYLIHQEKYEDAITYINNMKSDIFSNKGKWLREYALLYCREKMDV